MRYRDKVTGKFVPASFAASHPDRVAPVRVGGGRRRKRAKEAKKETRMVEYEITATTRGGTPRRRPEAGGRRVDGRVLQLKIRVIAPEGALFNEMDAVNMLRRTVALGHPPKGIDIRYIDWQKGLHGESSRRGTVPRTDAVAGLRDFWAAISSGRANIGLEGK